jgi:hypothetical protein
VNRYLVSIQLDEMIGDNEAREETHRAREHSLAKKVIERCCVYSGFLSNLSNRYGRSAANAS